MSQEGRHGCHHLWLPVLILIISVLPMVERDSYITHGACMDKNPLMGLVSNL